MSFAVFDRVQITAPAQASVIYLPPDTKFDAKGEWTVTGVRGDLLILVQDGVLIRISQAGVKRVSTYSLEQLFARLERISGYGKSDQKSTTSPKQTGSNTEQEIR